ncbi:MAG: LysM peptidoglycan-binding domain-containing protein [Phycisphaerae bacterium]
MTRMLVKTTGMAVALHDGRANKKDSTMANTDSGMYNQSAAYNTTQPNYYQNSGTTQGGYYAQPQSGAPADPYAAQEPYYASSVTTENGSAYAASDPGYAASSPSYGGTSYTVQKGDSLYVIARKMYGGDMSRWRDIYNANRDKIHHPDQLLIGSTLVIP